MTSMQKQIAGLYHLDPQLVGIFQAHIHQFPGDAAELAQQLAFRFLGADADDTLTDIFRKARGDVRRFNKGIAGGRPCCSLAELGDTPAPAEGDDQDESRPASWRRADVVRFVAETHRVSERHARTQVDDAIRRRKENGDLFGEDE